MKNRLHELQSNRDQDEAKYCSGFGLGNDRPSEFAVLWRKENSRNSQAARDADEVRSRFSGEWVRNDLQTALQ
jgi:hypothetical protein